jgi:ribosomal protein L16 Arg81 hydroxylase
MSATSVSPSISFPQEWRRWIIENKMQNLGDDKIVAVLISNGLNERQAHEEIERIDQREPIYEAGFRYAQKFKKLVSIMNVMHTTASLSAGHGVVQRKENVSREEFLESHYAASKPVILADVMENWRAVKCWTPEYLKAKCGDVEVEVMSGREADPNYEVNMESHKTKMLFRDFVDRVFSGVRTNDCYITGNNHFLENEKVHSLLEDIAAAPEYLNSDIPGFTFFWFGPAGTVTQPHHDELNILMCQVLGQKKVTLISPDQTPLVYNNLGVYSEVDWNTPDYERHPLFQRVESMEVTLMPGESLFIPVGWWHHVQSVEPSLSISFSNFLFPNEFQYADPEIRD